MLTHLRSKNFSVQFLKYLELDPVHEITETRTIERRCLSDRDIFFWVENNQPTAILCVAYIQKLVNNVSDILDKDSELRLFPSYAIFYSVFRTPVPPSSTNAGTTLLMEAAKWITENRKEIRHFVTMSPIPSLSKRFTEPPSLEKIHDYIMTRKDPVAKFHLNNGARLLRVIPNADSSPLRQDESWGTMVNYTYTHLMQNSKRTNK